MKKITEFMRKERLYLLLLTFIILINLAVMSDGYGRRHKDAGLKTDAVALSAGAGRSEPESPFLSRKVMENALAQDKTLAMLFGLSSLLMAVVFLLGVVVDILLVLQRMSKGRFDIETYRGPRAMWGIWDVARVAILFLFFGYMIVIIESFLLRTAPVLKNDNLRMMINTSILDIMAVAFILFFTVKQYKEKLISLGLSAKNLAKNIFYGLVGYIASIPILVAVLAVIALIVHLTKYIPEKQPVVELFLKEENQPFLIYTSLFTAVVGPFIEELFFRGFMYNAFKKRIGIFWAMLITSAVFASLHTNIVGFAPILVLGMLLAYLYEKTGTLVAPITVHMLHNLSMVFLVFLMKSVKA